MSGFLKSALRLRWKRKHQITLLKVIFRSIRSSLIINRVISIFLEPCVIHESMNESWITNISGVVCMSNSFQCTLANKSICICACSLPCYQIGTRNNDRHITLFRAWERKKALTKLNNNVIYSMNERGKGWGVCFVLKANNPYPKTWLVIDYRPILKWPL